MFNPFLAKPLLVNVYDPLKQHVSETYCFIGDMPKYVMEAVRQFSHGGNNRAVHNTLKDYFGPKYIKRLGVRDKKGSTAPIGDAVEGADAVGGADIISSMSLGDLDDIADLLEQTDERPARSIISVSQSIAAYKAPPETHRTNYIFDVHIYPEDKISELKDKIYLATGIPPYRQHLFYMQPHEDENRYNTTYITYVNGIYPIDIRELNSKYKVLNIPVDRTLYDLRADIKVEEIDTFRILATTPHTMYIVDLAQFIAPIYTQVQGIINDTYQMEMLYYGFIIKFWPQLTRECFYDYIINENELTHKFPDLAPDRDILRRIHNDEKLISDFNYCNYARAQNKLANGGVAVAITQMTAYINPLVPTMLNIRNLFDKLRVSRCIPEIYAYLDRDNKNYMLRKHHSRNETDIQVPSSAVVKQGLTMIVSLRKQDQDSYHARKAITVAENEHNRYLFLTIWPSGRYYIKTMWNEEDEYSFAEIINIMKYFVDPIIEQVNRLGRYIFVTGAALPIISKHTVRYHGLNICVLWKKVMSETHFKNIKQMWGEYMQARITGIRNVQQHDKFEFMFRKGMHEFEPALIERIMASSNQIVLSNYFARLSNNTIKQKWDQNYDGRIVRMSHRTTDVKFEVLDIMENEFHIFYLYVIMFIYRAMDSEKLRITAPAHQAKHATSISGKKLQKLKEQDPALYNLKRSGGPRVYSIICQNQRQPLIYTPDELNNMSKAQMQKLVKYWNFTHNAPAYYSCPNPEYPHFSFIAGSHPKNYCIPCCSKKLLEDREDNKKSRITSICFEKHKFEAADLEDNAQSRYIINYGKEIDLDRLSKMPNILTRLFQVKGDDPRSYYLYGVLQNLPWLNHCGLIYAIADALDMDFNDYIAEIMAYVKKSAAQLYYMLINGALSKFFEDVDTFVSAMTNIFAASKAHIGTGSKFDQWNELFIELTYLAFDAFVFCFIDASGGGEKVDLFVTSTMRSHIEKSGHTARNYIICLKRINLYYPIYLIESERYFKDNDVIARNYKKDDNIVQIILKMTATSIGDNKYKANQALDLTFYSAFTSVGKNALGAAEDISEIAQALGGAAAAPVYKMRRMYINKQNLCYGLLIEASNGKFVYAPIEYSAYVASGVEISFNAFALAESGTSVAATMALIADVNSYIKANYTISENVYTYAPIKIKAVAVHEERPIAIITTLGRASSGAYYYFEHADDEMPADVPNVNIRYNWLDINALVMKRAPAISDNTTTKIGAALYSNYIYQLFTLEFINYIDNMKNRPMRNKLAEIIGGLTGDLAKFREDLARLLVAYPADIATINQIISSLHRTNKSDIADVIESATFEFDREMLLKMRKLSHSELKNEIIQMARHFVVNKDISVADITFPNIYMPCGTQDDTGYCDGKKLIMNRPIEPFADILAADILNDLKFKYIFSNTWMETVIDYFRFDQHPGEKINIYRIME